MVLIIFTTYYFVNNETILTLYPINELPFQGDFHSFTYITGRCPVLKQIALSGRIALVESHI